MVLCLLCAACQQSTPPPTLEPPQTSIDDSPTPDVVASAGGDESGDLRTKCKEVFAEVLRCASENDHERLMEITVDRHHGPPTSYWHHSLGTLRAYLSADDYNEFQTQLVEFGEQCVLIQEQLPTMKFEEPKFKEDTHVLNLDLVSRDDLREFDANRKSHEEKLQEPAKLYLVLNAIEINGQTQEGNLGFVIIDDKVLYVPW